MLNRETFVINIEPAWYALTLYIGKVYQKLDQKSVKWLYKAFSWSFETKKILAHQLLHQETFGNNIEPAWCALTFIHEEGIPKTWPKSCKLNIRCFFLRLWNKKKLFYFASSVVEPRNFRDKHWISLICSNFMYWEGIPKTRPKTCKLVMKGIFFKFWRKKNFFASSVAAPRSFREQHWTSLMCSNFLTLGRYTKNVTKNL